MNWLDFALQQKYIATATELIYFLDGKEKWSTTYSDVSADDIRWPSSIHGGHSNHPCSMMINFGVSNWNGIPTWSSKQMLVDYYRYYTPKPGIDLSNPQTVAFQNLSSSGVAQTLESPHNDGYAIPPANSSPPNNNNLEIANTHTHWTHFLSPSTNIAYTNEPGSQKIYYAGADGRCYNSYYQSGQWYEYPLVSWVMDVNSDITVDKDRVYYISFSGQLKFFQWVSSLNQWVNSNAWQLIANVLTPVNVAGSLNVDVFGRVSYIDHSGNVNVWAPNSYNVGQVIALTNANNAYAGLTMHSCGCLLFYEDFSNNLRQLSWWNTWRNQGIVKSNIVTSGMTLDERNSLLYFIDNNFRIQRYAWDYNQANPTGLMRLGYSSYCSGQANSNSFIDPYSTPVGLITLSNDKNTVYYAGADNKLWYYFTDHDHADVQANSEFIPENWNTSPINYSIKTATRPGLVVEPYGNGRIFYVGNDDIVHLIDWANADNPITCPMLANTNPKSAETYLTRPKDSTATGEQVLANTQGLNIAVMPNPSSNIFTFTITGLVEDNKLMVIITDISGREIERIKTLAQAQQSAFSWNAEDVSSGIYFFTATLNGKRTLTGKLIKQ